MAFSYTISPENELVYVQLIRTTQFREITDCIGEVVFDTQFQSDYDILIEMRAHYIPTASEIKQIAELIVSLETQFKKKVALVVPNDLLFTMISLATHYIIQKTDIDIRLFTGTNEAMDWLGK